MKFSPEEARKMAMEELTDAVAWRRAALLAPSQAEWILLQLRRMEAQSVDAIDPHDGSEGKLSTRDE